uniref:Uncharacterized protein n=1 Tax=Oryza sativa subsp. japonica TaxID=39947 RepID=Q6Z9W7_ORYSJ|nr:hypothetical protein [Oryza sativa Japonica Group]
MAAARSRAPWLDLAVVRAGWAWGGTEVDAARGGAVGEGRRLSRHGRQQRKAVVAHEAMAGMDVKVQPVTVGD